MIVRLGPVILAGALLLPSVARGQQGEPGLVGPWSAEEEYFRAIILIEQDQAGELRVSFANDDLSPGAPLSRLTVRGDSVFFEASHLDVRFGGAFTVDGPAIRGTYTQGDASVPITLVPAGARAAAPRPQHPVPPYPYASEEVGFRSEPSGIRLAGTLTIPAGPGPHPAVVLVPGTGNNDRDYEMNGHRLFLVLADGLTRDGIAVLRYDERGVGESGGDPYAASLDDQAADVAAAMRYLRGRPEVDTERVGIVGHSIGGVLAPRVHERLERAAFLVLLVAPAAPLLGLFQEQGPRMAAAHGAPAAEVEAFRALGAALVSAAAADTDSLTAAAAMAAAYDAAGWPDEAREQGIRANTSPGYRDLVRYDPGPSLHHVDIPVLAVYGRSDLAVTPEENAAAMAAGLTASRSGDATVLVVEGLNHQLQPSATGREDEAAATEVTVAPMILDLLTDWVRRQTGLRY